MKYRNDLDKTVFREYDIRGEYPKQIDEDFAYSIGLAFGTKIRNLGKTWCVVGHDNRLSGESLSDALIEGIRKTGINVKYLGLCTTPMYYFSCLDLEIDSGIMVTASHNPVNDNGFKIAFDNYDNACGDLIKEFYSLATSGDFLKGEGLLEKIDLKEKYVNRVIKDIKINKRLKVVIDPANASGTYVMKDIFDKLNVEPIYINDISDGRFPNHHPDPLVPENMKQISDKVRETNADIGIAVDGDADRLGIVNELGEIIPIDTYMALIWDDILPNADNKRCEFDVKCSNQLKDEIIRIGGTPDIYRTGNSYQKKYVKDNDLIFGGELSGHVFFRDRWPGFDDGFYAGIRLLEILSKTDKKLSELDDHLNKYYSTPEIKVPVREDNKFEIVKRIKDYCISEKIKFIDIDGVRAEFDDGWALVRASNTGPNLTTRFESKTKERLNEIQSLFENLIEEYK